MRVRDHSKIKNHGCEALHSQEAESFFHSVNQTEIVIALQPAMYLFPAIALSAVSATGRTEIDEMLAVHGICYDLDM